MNKNILRSKTFWLQVVTFISVLVPPVQAWLVANPVDFIAAVAAANTLVRFVTKDKVTLLTGDDKPSGIIPTILLLFVAVLFLPSCVTTTAKDGTVTREPNQEVIRESISFGQWLVQAFRTPAPAPVPVVISESNK